MKPIRIISSRWAAPAAAVVAFGAALLVGRLIWAPHFPHDRWPRRMTVIERIVAPDDQPRFLARLCHEGEERGFTCRIGAGDRSLVPVRFVELWEDDVHISALAVVPSPLVRIEMFADTKDSARGDEAWVRSL